MNLNPTPPSGNSKRGFTLIELLVVIAVIALLAGLMFPVTAAVNRTKIKKKARAELEQVAAMIEGYKDKLGNYPPQDGNRAFFLTPLYYELSGTKRLPTGMFETLDRNSNIMPVPLATAFGLNGLVNAMAVDQNGNRNDEAKPALQFTAGLKPGQVAPLNQADAEGPKIIVCTVGWKNPGTPIVTDNPTVSPFFYNGSNPVHNPNSFDLWVDVIVDGKTNRISNWNKDPFIP